MDQEFIEEAAFHLQMETEELIRNGVDPVEARRQADIAFGGVERYREKARSARGTQPLEDLIQDMRYAGRSLRKRPLFAVVAVLTLGLGIGASTTMFSVVNGVLLDPLPYPDSERLVYVGTTYGGGELRGTTAPEFLALKRETGTLEEYAAYFGSSVGFLLGERPEQFRVVGASEDYVEVFGASPILGRAFSEEDFRPGAPPVALLSHGAWQRHWGGNPEVIGTVISSIEPPSPALPAAAAPTIIGVMPASMDDRSDLWVPLRLADAQWWGREMQFQNWILRSVGRLRSGSSLADARAEMSGLATRLASEYPQHYSGRRLEGRSLGAVLLLDRIVGSYRARVLLFFAGALLLLAIAVANLAGLFLSRALDRRREFAVRAALGGGRSRILRHLVTETMFLSLLGGGMGFALAMGCLEVLRALAPTDLPRLDNLSPDVRVVLFALAIALASGLFCALASLPSRKGGALGTSLRETDRTGSDRGTARLRGLLVSAQMSLAVILLVGAGLLSASLAKLRRVDPGIEVEGLLVMPIPFPASRETPETQRAFLVDVVRRIDAVPGVVSASWTPDPPMYWSNWFPYIRTEETMDLDEEQLPRTGTHPVGPDFLSTMGIPILRGRGITWGDDATSPPVVVVDEVAAERLWPSQDPMGKQLAINDEWHAVVGVAGRVHQSALSEDVVPEIYLPSLQSAFFSTPTVVTIRSGIPVEGVAEALRAAVWEVDRTVPIPFIRAAEDRISGHLRNPRFLALLGSAFALSALVLTLAAIFGLMSFWVTSRTREFGLHMALGARAGQVLWAVQRQCMRMVLIGLGAGLVLAAGTSRLLSAFLFGVSSLDLPTYALVGIGLGASALLASMIPALRATRVEPTVALMGE